MTIPERAAQIAVQIAKDDRHGYSQENRYGSLEAGDFDCSSLVIYCYDLAMKENGKTPPRAAGATYTGNMLSAFTRLGFKSFKGDHGAGLKVGDILLNERKHTAIVCSVNPVMVVNARGNLDGFAGDSSGNEIRIQPYWDYPWDFVIRLESDEAASTPQQTVGQQMADKVVEGRYKSDANAIKENLLVPVLEMYMKGQAVETMQVLLTLNGYDVHGADGEFGPKTYKALCDFQIFLGRVSGKCDAYTWDKLIKGADKDDSANR